MADTKIKDLPAKTTVDSDDEIVINDVTNGNVDKKEGMDDIKTFMSKSPTFTTKQTTDPIFINEAASASADVAGDGQIWVKNETPNVLYFTDDAGTDFELASKTGTHAATQSFVIAA